MLVKEAMTKEVISITPEYSVEDAIKIFSENRISGSPVVKNGKIIGMLSESDILKKLGVKHLLFYVTQEELERLKRLLSTNLTVENVMKKEIYTIREDANLAEAAKTMNLGDVNRLPVIDSQGNLVGIITRGDVIRAVAKSLGSLTLLEKKEPMLLETDVDKLLQIIEEKKSISIDNLAKQLKISEEKIEEWGKILEDHDLIEFEFPAIGKPILKSKKR